MRPAVRARALDNRVGGVGLARWRHPGIEPLRHSAEVGHPRAGADREHPVASPMSAEPDTGGYPEAATDQKVRGPMSPSELPRMNEEFYLLLEAFPQMFVQPGNCSVHF